MVLQQHQTSDYAKAAHGDWLQIKGAIKEKWGQLTDDEITEINGSKDKLIGKLVSSYHMAKDKATQEVNDFWTN